MSSDLLPCPGCGSGQIVSDSNGDDQHWYTCNGCGLSGPTANDPIAALTPWNALPRKPTWSKSPPDQPGLWACRNNGVVMYRFLVRRQPDDRLCASTTGQPVYQPEGAEWAGPYPEPGERKDGDG